MPLLIRPGPELATARPSGRAEPPPEDALPVQADEKIKALVARCIDDAVNNTARMDRDRQDLLNLLFYRGGVDNQWVRWNQAQNSWERQPEDGENGIP